MEKNIENCLMDYVDAQRPIIYINHFDGTVIDKALKHIGRGTHIHEYNNALGVLWSSIFVTLVAKKDQGSYALTRAS